GSGVYTEAASMAGSVAKAIIVGLRRRQGSRFPIVASHGREINSSRSEARVTPATRGAWAWNESCANWHCPSPAVTISSGQPSRRTGDVRRNALEGLTACAGSWRGTNTLQDANTGKPEASPSTVTVTPVLAGRFIRLDYTWGYQGKPQEGSLLVGFDPKIGEV